MIYTMKKYVMIMGLISLVGLSDGETADLTSSSDESIKEVPNNSKNQKNEGMKDHPLDVLPLSEREAFENFVTHKDYIEETVYEEWRKKIFRRA